MANFAAIVAEHFRIGPIAFLAIPGKVSRLAAVVTLHSPGLVWAFPRQMSCLATVIAGVVSALLLLVGAALGHVSRSVTIVTYDLIIGLAFSRHVSKFATFEAFYLRQIHFGSLFDQALAILLRV